MIDAFKRFAKKELGIDDQKILLTVSGGIDSVCMVELFQEAGLNYCICHCNFKLRGEDSDKDEEFVKKMAQANNVEFYSTSFDTFAYSRDHGLSIQMAARKLRYDWFRSIKDQNNCNYIATAHHLNDSLETAIFNLSKGTGIAGLKGISAKADDIIRPLLFATKSMIQNYADAKDLKWREDESNKSVKYNRNFIRHQIIDLLKKRINPSIERTFQETSERLKTVEIVFAKHIQSLRENYFFDKKTHVRIDVNWVNSKDMVPLVYELVKDFGFSYKQSKEIFEGTELSGGNFYSEDFWLVRDRDQLIITRKQDRQADVEVAGTESEIKDDNLIIEVLQTSVNDVSIIKDSEYAYLDKSLLKFPLVIRSWQEGDWFRPLGMKGKKKVSDFMIDQKIPVNLKRQVRILTSGDRIVWLIGLRIDDHFKISSKTEQVYRLKILKANA